jgi:hypothetical protein
MWRKDKKTLWIDEKCETMLEGDLDLGRWCMEREGDGWRMTWPVAEGGFEEIKMKLANEYDHVTVQGEDGKTAKKEDHAKALGKAEALRNIM